MQGGREKSDTSLLGRPWRRHLRRDTPRRWVRALPKRRGAASAIPPRALFLPDDSLPFINSANVRLVPALEPLPRTAVTSFWDLASTERVLGVCVCVCDVLSPPGCCGATLAASRACGGRDWLKTWWLLLPRNSLLWRFALVCLK